MQPIKLVARQTLTEEQKAWLQELEDKVNEGIEKANRMELQIKSMHESNITEVIKQTAGLSVDIVQAGQAPKHA